MESGYLWVTIDSPDSIYMARKNQTFYEILNQSAETKTVDLLIYGAIPDWNEDDWKIKNSAESFLREFKALEKDYDRINIHINSPGGSLYHAFPIFNAILNSKKDIHTYNDGLAASAGGLLLLAGKKIHSAKNGILMIHNAMSWSSGNADALRNVAKILDTYDNAIAKLFAERTGMTEAEVKEKYLNYKDHWLDADEAKAAGFVHEIEEYESEDAPPSNISQMAFGEVLNLYREKEVRSESFIDKIVNKVRAVLAPGFNPAQPDNPTPFDSAQGDTKQNQQPKTDMDFKAALDILNKENPSAEELQAVKNDILAFTGANEKFTAEEVNAKIDAVKADITAQLDTVKNEKTQLETKNTELQNLVDSYKASGVTPSNTAGGTPDPIPGDDVDNFVSETDLEIKRIKAAQAVK
jgi:ATP-dependent protease ClpP protease subunit